MDFHLDCVSFLPQLKYVFPVDLQLDSRYYCLILVLALDSIFLVLKHLIFGLDVADLILEGNEFVFFVFELIELFFE